MHDGIVQSCSVAEHFFSVFKRTRSEELFYSHVLIHKIGESRFGSKQEFTGHSYAGPIGRIGATRNIIRVLG